MLTLSDAAEQIRTRKLSPVELTRQCVSRIERLNPALNAFITVTHELALQQAQQAEQEVTAGKWRGPLHGIPFGLKDMLDTADVLTTAGSNQYRQRIPSEDAGLVRQLKDAGAVILGKTNLQEFAFGGSGVVSAYGPANNPWDLARITGGSSSGSAAAVAAGLCVAAIGTDTAGSVRCPAALCGIVGHRPSAHLLSLEGVIPLAPTFDTVGPLTKTVRDSALVLDALALNGPGSVLAGLLEQGIARTVVGIPRAGFFDNLDADVQSVIEQALTVIGSLVTEVRDVSLALAGRGQVFSAEIYEYHEAMMTKSPDLYQPHTLARLKTCEGISASEYIRDVRKLGGERRAAHQLFETVDLLVMPTTPAPAPPLSELQTFSPPELRQFEMKYLLRNTEPFSTLFWPCVSVPCGFTRDGLPVGLQIAGAPGADAAVLRLAYAYQEATEWSTRKPAIAGD